MPPKNPKTPDQILPKPQLVVFESLDEMDKDVILLYITGYGEVFRLMIGDRRVGAFILDFHHAWDSQIFCGETAHLPGCCPGHGKLDKLESVIVSFCLILGCSESNFFRFFSVVHDEVVSRLGNHLLAPKDGARQCKQLPCRRAAMASVEATAVC